MKLFLPREIDGYFAFEDMIIFNLICWNNYELELLDEQEEEKNPTIK